MVKTPRTRHSKAARQPVTIDLAPDEVSRVEAEAAKTEEEAAAAPPQAPESEAAAHGPDERVEEQAPPEPVSEPVSEPAFGRREPPPASPPATSGGGGALAGAVAGGVIALLVAGGLHFSGLLPASAPEDHGPAVATLETRLAELREQVAALGAGGGDDVLAGRVAEAEERVAALGAALETLEAEVSAFDARPVDLSPLEERIAAVETAVAAADASAAPQADLSGVEADIAALREGQAAGSARLEALEEQFAGLAGRIDEQAEAPATAVIIAASALKAAIDRGMPFATELETFAALAPGAPEIEELRAYAADGVATRAQLAAESDAAASAMITAAAPVDPEAGIVDRLWASAMGLVQVRPVGMVEGDGVPEIAARLDAAVGQGDYERAIAEFETLPEASQAAGAAFMERLRARHAADRLIDQALAAALRA